MNRLNDLEEVLENIRLLSARDVNTSLPAIVESYDPVTQKASIVFALYLTDPTGRKRPFPNLQDIPVQFPSTTLTSITYPLNRGDTGWFHFSKHSVENWLFRNEATPTNVEDSRVHDIQDGYFVPGVWPFKLAPNEPAKHNLPHSTADLALVHGLGTANECELRLKADGSIKVTSKGSQAILTLSPSGEVSVTATSATVNVPTTNWTGDINLTGTLTASVDVVGGGKSLKTHTHGGVTTGGGVTGAPV